MSDSIDDAVSATCRRCRSLFRPTPSQIRKTDYECKACKRTRQNTANANNPQFRNKWKAQNAKPHVRAYRKRYRAYRLANDPLFRGILAARKKVETELAAGRISRKPCEVCGNTKAEAHHEDYSKPLSVLWLCRRHHVIADAMLAARKGGAT